MSTGLNCTFEEVEPGIWYYLLENDSAPKRAWDWREYATAYGPFKTEEAANNHLSEHHANPGGYSVTTYKDRKGEPIDETLRELIKNRITPERMDQLQGRYIWQPRR